MVPIVELIRLEEDYDHGTFGVLKINKEAFCCTLEPDDRLNRSNVSSIPAQQYMCHRYQSPTFGKLFKVMDVTGRSDVLFHKGNTADNTHGCILLGQYFGKLKENRAVLNSGNTFDAFMAHMDGHNQFHLTIREVY